jgi:hypothetical protein
VWEESGEGGEGEAVCSEGGRILKVEAASTFEMELRAVQEETKKKVEQVYVVTKVSISEMWLRIAKLPEAFINIARSDLIYYLRR